MTKKIKSIKDVRASFGLLRSQKYNAGLWIESLDRGFSGIAQIAHGASGIVQLDVLDNLLPILVKDETRPLGVFDVNDLTHWLEKQSTGIASDQGAICTEIDAILATFSRTGAKEFFEIAHRLVLQKPIVLVTKLKSMALASQFFNDRLWELEMGEA